MPAAFPSLCIALLAALVLTAISLQSLGNEIRRYRSNPSADIIFDIKEHKDPVFPLSLKRQGVEEGVVTYAVFVNEFGELADYLLLEATHLSFADAVERVLDDWDYSVSTIDGDTAAVVGRITVRFKRGKGVVYETSGYENFQFQFGALHDNEFAYRICSPWELDRLPVPTHIENPSFHTTLLEERDTVNAVFEFYIDQQGHVRIPTLREADEAVDERLLVTAQNALLQWRFAPPQSKGKTVVVKVAQPIIFKRDLSPETVD